MGILERMKELDTAGAVVGVSDHAGWAILITVARDGTIVDRRRVELVDAGLPSMPHHHDAQALAVSEAVELIERVRLSIERHASLALETLATDVASPIHAIALRKLQPLPATIVDRIRDYRARNVADWVMYRQALAKAAESRGCLVHWYDPKTVFDAAAQTLHVKTLDGHFLQARRTLGSPWNHDHKLAMAAAIAGHAEDVST
jgi:hypothetical protein